MGGKTDKEVEYKKNQARDDDWLIGMEPYVVKEEMMEPHIDETMNEEMIQKKQIVESMEAVAMEFKDVYSEYYRNKKSDVQLLEYTTQPFWQSMRLSKRRLHEKGLTLEIDMMKEINRNSDVFQEKFKVGKRPVKYKMQLEGEEQCEAGQCRENVLVRRRFHKDGKCICKKVESEQHVATCLKYKVDGDKAVCPNCGYISTIASFIDGCDACGSRFTVRDFEPKISGFSFEQNEYIRLKSLTRSINGMLWCVFLLTMATSTLFIFITPYFQNTSWIGYTAKMVIVAFIAMFIGVIFLTLFGTISSTITYIVRSTYDKNIDGEDVAERTVCNISANDFFQNLEYKIRNIHFANDEKEITGFAKCKLTDVLQSYRDVVDCSVIKLSFIDGKTTKDGYHLDCIAQIRNTNYQGKKISYTYEDVNIGVNGKKGVVDKSVTAINLYICKNCGSTLNLLEGVICQSCGTEYDLEDYDWVIDRYEAENRKIKWPIFVRIGIIILYLVIVFGTAFAVPIRMNRISVGGMTIYDEKTEEEIEETTESMTKEETATEEVMTEDRMVKENTTEVIWDNIIDSMQDVIKKQNE